MISHQRRALLEINMAFGVRRRDVPSRCGRPFVDPALCLHIVHECDVMQRAARNRISKPCKQQAARNGKIVDLLMLPKPLRQRDRPFLAADRVDFEQLRLGRSGSRVHFAMAAGDAPHILLSGGHRSVIGKRALLRVVPVHFAVRIRSAVNVPPLIGSDPPMMRFSRRRPELLRLIPARHVTVQQTAPGRPDI